MQHAGLDWVTKWGPQSLDLTLFGYASNFTAGEQQLVMILHVPHVTEGQLVLIQSDMK